MASRFENIPLRRAIIDRRALGEAVAGLPYPIPAHAVPLLREALAKGRAEIGRRLAVYPTRGLEAAGGQAYLVDGILRVLFDCALHLYPDAAPVGLLAVGGYGRAEMAAHSDVDIAFVSPAPEAPEVRHLVEAVLYALWDLGLKVGHSVRTIDDTVAQARADITIRTALLESRPVTGDAALLADVARRFKAEVQRGTERRFVADKLAERDTRHLRMGDTRYVVEPNVKEGKGALRDLHTLFWIGKYVHDVQRARQLVDVGLFTPAEYRLFHRADEFLWAVRCHLHQIAGRAEDRLTFDVQREVAARMRFQDRGGRPAVERFMQFYFLQARTVGTLTGVFLAHLDERFAARGRRWLPSLPSFRRKPGKLHGFVLDRGRLALPDEGFFRADPVRLVELFQLADLHGVEVHPLAMRAAARDAKLIDDHRADPRANALFLDILTSPRDPETVLRWMNEANVLGRFIPDWARIVAQMQFDMYHHYTVDEHTIRAIGLLRRIEAGELKEDHPLASGIIDQIVSRRALRVAVLLHDIAKGRGGDHSLLGAEVAERLCPRFGLTPAETETVAWLVRHHLLMSRTAFKRDLSDFKTILDFAGAVASPERLRLLLVLTVVDIRAVGPGTWNGWKRQLLSDLFEAAEEVLRLGHKQRGRTERIAAKQERLQRSLDWQADRFGAFVARMPEPYWIAEPDDVLLGNARLIAAAGDAPLSIGAVVDADRGATLVTIYAADHPGLFYRIAGAIHVAGGNIIDARIHTTRDGMAIDNFLVQDPWGRPFDDTNQLQRLRTAIEDALANRGKLADRLIARPLPRSRAEAFPIAPNVLIDNRASNRFTVVEVNARDRPALLNQLAHALFQSKVTVHSAHVATYGERAVDIFYLTDLTGDRIDNPARLKALERRLLAAAAGEPEAMVA